MLVIISCYDCCIIFEGFLGFVVFFLNVMLFNICLDKKFY